MRAAAEKLADIMHVGAHIEPFAAQDAEIDFRQHDPIDCVAIDVHQSRLSLDYFALARQLVERYATVFFRRNHWRQLIKIASELFKRGATLIFIEGAHLP